MKISQDLKDQVRIVYHPLYLADYPQVSCESPDRIQSILTTLSDDFTIIQPSPCNEEDLLRCHSQELVNLEKTCTERFPSAVMAAGGAIRAAEIGLQGFVGFGLVRPPGHHANPDHNWGFCYFNNMAVAIKKLLADNLITSAVILDIDLHYGDGTASIFKESKNVRVLNIQSSTPEEFIRETENALEGTSYTGILGISAGFDQYVLDWGGNLSTGDYRIIGTVAGRFAEMKAQGRIFGILEGGYYIPDLGKNLVALLAGIVEGKAGG